MRRCPRIFDNPDLAAKFLAYLNPQHSKIPFTLETESIEPCLFLIA